MKKINFLFGVHCHQPVGNFDHIFQESFDRCYNPFIDILLKHQGVRCALHFSGPLLEWIEENKKEYFDKITTLIDRNQVELLSGGFYEPIITVIPEKDAVDQIKFMTGYIKDRFKKSPRGMWLAERVWEPTLPSILNKADIDYSVLDESHFIHAGLTQKDMFGYYNTEDRGKSLKLFPIDKKLRYLVPFNSPESTIDYLREISSTDHSKAVTLADDGEKFGVWPNTYKWVFEEGYLDKLFTLLEENSDWISMPTFSEYIEKYPAMDNIYLPTASYEEMMEWALPAKTIVGYEKALKIIEEKNCVQEIKPFLRGGFWRNFLAKYHESNLMHKKMIRVSELVHKYIPKDNEAKKYLWRGQCNCAYWHGLFGGLYLNYLRDAIYKNLNKAEKLVDKKRFNKKKWQNIEKLDFFCDGTDKILISSNILNLFIDPQHGASCFELDFKPSDFNLTNTFSRKYEAYHEKLKLIKSDDDSSNSDNQPASIHDIVSSKEDGLDKVLFYDKYHRYSFLDHFLATDISIDDLIAQKYQDLTDFAGQSYQIKSIIHNDNEISALLTKTGEILSEEGRIPFSLSKKYILKKNNGVVLNYTFKNVSVKENLTFLFGSEMNFTYLAADDPLRYFIVRDTKEPMNIKSSMNNVDNITMINEWDNIRTEISFTETTKLWRFPVETVSQSESGFEKNYQNSSILPLWEISIPPNKSTKISLSIILKSVK